MSRPQNPYLNRYKKDLETRANAREKQNQNETLRKIGATAAVGTGIALGIHGATPGGLYEAGSSMARAFSSIKHAATRPEIKHTIKREKDNLLSGRDTNIKGAASEIATEFKLSYQKKKQQQLGRLKRDASSYTDRSVFDIISRRERGRKSIDYMDNRMKKDRMHRTLSTTIDQRIDSLDGSEAEALRKAKQGVEHKLTHMHETSFYDEDRFVYEMQKISKEYGVKPAKDMADILGTSVKFNKVIPPEVSNVKSTLRNHLDEDIIKRGTGQDDRGIVGNVSRFMKDVVSNALGYKKASARDLRGLSKEGKVDMKDETMRFLDNLEDSRDVNLGEFFLDDNLFMRGDRLVDTKPMDDFFEGVKQATSEGIIGRILFASDARHYSKVDEQFPVKIMKPGQKQPVLSDLKDQGILDDRGVLKKTLVGIEDKIYSLDDPTEPLRENMQFTTGRFGATKRLLTQMSGVEAPDMEDANFLRKHLDIGFREEPSFYEKVKSTFTKGSNQEFMPNKIEQIFSGGKQPTAEDVFAIEDYFKTYNKGLDEDLFNMIASQSKVGTKGASLTFDTKEEIMSSFEHIANQSDESVRKTSSLFQQYKRDPESVLSKTRMIKRPEWGRPNEILTGPEMVQKETSKMVFSSNKFDENLTMIDELLDEGFISNEQHLQAKSLAAESYFDQMRLSDTSKRGVTSPGGEGIRKLLHENVEGKGKDFQNIVKEMSKKTHPIHSQGPVEGYSGNYVGDIIAMNKMDSERIRDFDLGYMKDMALGTFTRGRKDMSEVQYHDLMGYGVFSRLNTLLGDSSLASLSLSDNSLGSTGDIFKNLFTKRLLPAYGAVKGFQYINDYSDRVGDYTIRQKYERTKAGTRLNMAKAKDATGITSGIQTLDKLTPGSENLVESLHSVPVAGWAADWTGATSSKSHDDWVDYHKHGYDEVRDGRWWPLGNQPWMGEGVSHHVPNSYKRAMSEWQYTDTVYGDKDNYWERSFFPNHTMLPTMDDPLRPFRRLNPYWFEQKHKERRPYEMSGEMFDPRNPFGAVGNMTVGRVLKPGIDYGAGASDEFVEEREERYDMDHYTIGQWSHGDLDFYNITPYDNVPSEFSQASQEDGYAYQVAQNMQHQSNEAAKVKAATGDTEGGYIGTASGVNKGSTQSKNAIHQSNVAMKEEALAGRTTGSDVSKEQLLYQNENLKAEAEAGRINASDMSKEQLALINQSIKEEAEMVQVDERELDSLGFSSDYPFDMGRTPRDSEIQDPRSLEYRARKFGYLSKYLAGSRGFIGASVAFGNVHSEGEQVIERADEAYSTSSRFWDMDPGGRGMAFSEVARRMMNRPRGRMDRVNRLPNTMPGWLPGDDYFLDLQHGDAYGKVDRGEIRLPGEAYESLNQLHPDEYGMYGAVDRASILADVAPYSKEADFWLDAAREQDLTEEEQEFLDRSLERADKQKDNYFITPYQFKGDVDRETQRIEKFVGPGRFRVEDDNQVYRMAGIERLDFSGETEESLRQLEVLQESMMPGAEVDITKESDAEYGDTSVPVVVHNEGTNINRMLLGSGAEEKDEESTIEGHAKHTPIGRAIGRTWETVSHAPLPFVHNKFISAQSPREHLERNNLYDKSFKNWSKPVEDIVKPAFHSSFAESPIMGGLKLGASFALIGSLIINPRHAGTLFKTGAGVGAAGSTAVSMKERSTGEAWIPEYRRDEREIEEYFDKLEYIKNKRLFNKYADLAEREEGTDIREMIEEFEEMEEKQREEVQRIENFKDSVAEEQEGEVKRWINNEGRVEVGLATSREYIQHKQSELNEELREMREGETLFNLGPYTKRAIEYRDEYKSTLFAANPDNINYERIYRSLPQKDREYFSHFAEESDPQEREEILRLLPENQQRIYKMLWGEDVEENTEEDLEEYFRDYALPESDWVGWREGVDLEHSKAKVIENEGMDVNSFGLWKDYTVDEKLTPPPTNSGQSFDTGTRASNARLQSILDGYNINDLEIEVKPINGKKPKLNMNLNYDVTDRITSGIEKLLA